MLRKVAPGQAPWGTNGQPQPTLDGNNVYDWTAGTILLSGEASPRQLYYLFGWVEDPYNLFNGGGEGTVGFNYQCARCHTAGYRFDGKGPEPTLADASTPISNAQLSRFPASGKAGDTSSWFLSGIQCERCHKADMQYDGTVVNPNIFNSATTTNGRISHLVKLAPGSTLPADFTLATCSGTGCRPLPNVPVNEKSTKLCIECHRSEITAGVVGVAGSIHLGQLPGQTLGIPGVADGAFKSSGSCSIAHVPAYTYDQCMTAGGTWPYKPSMSHGANGAQAFLNSPHARFVGTIDQTTQNSADLSITLNGTYNSHFVDEGQAPEAVTGTDNATVVGDATKNGGCANCHDVHNTLLGSEVNASPLAEGLVRQCTECHMPTGGSRYAVAMPNHSAGDGTPFPTGADSSEACIICHMAAANGSPSYHYLRINPDSSYTTFPSARTYYTTYGSGKPGQLNSYNETYYSATGPKTYQAVGLDVDIACGQCHTGGDGKSNPYGIVPTNAPAFTRAALSTFATGIHNSVPKTAAAPTFSMAGSTYSAPISVVISETTPNAQICYTTDGTTPSWQDTTPTAEVATMSCKVGTQAASGVAVNISTTTTLKAVAGGTNSIGNVFTPSAVVSRTYTINLVPTAPTFSPVSGTKLAKGSLVTINAQAGMTIYYTLNGSIPTTTVSSTNFLCGVGSCQTTAINAASYVRAIAVSGGGQKSGVSTAVYSVQ